MTEPIFNSTYGNGFEGLLNYSNELVGGMFVNAFLFVVFVITTYVLSKSEWKMSAVLSFSFFVCLLIAMIFKLFTTVAEAVIFILIIGLAGSVLWSIISAKE